MRQIRQVMRLALASGQSQRAIARSLNISRDAVADYLTRAAAAGLPWPLPEEIDDGELERRLFPAAPCAIKAAKQEPDWGDVHLALKPKGSTLQVLHEEYRADKPEANNWRDLSSKCRYCGAVQNQQKHALQDVRTEV